MNDPMDMSASNEHAIDSRTGAPWYHYVGAMLIGWAIAAFMYTYQRIRTLFCGSPLTEGTFHFTNFSILQPPSVFQHFHSMDFLPPFQPFPRYNTGRYQSCKNYIDRVSEPTRSPQLDCKQDKFVFFDQSCLRDCAVFSPFHNCFACVLLSVFYFFSPKFIFIILSVFPSFSFSQLLCCVICWEQ